MARHFKREVEHGNVAEVTRLIPDTPLLVRLKALKYAVERDQEDIVRALLSGDTPAESFLLVQATQDDHRGIVQLLLEHGVDLNGTYKNTTALVHAVRVGDEDLVKMLLEAQADVEVTINGQSPLFIAIQKNYVGIARLLSQYGATASGLIWDDLVRKAFNRSNVKLLRILVNVGADLKVLEDGLIHAIHHKLSDVFDLLLEANIGLNAREKHGVTPLMLVSKKGDYEKAKKLLDANINVNEVGDNGLSSLMLAAKHGKQEVLQLLLDWGANPEMKTNSGDTALGFARKHYPGKVVLEEALSYALDTNKYRSCDISYFPIGKIASNHADEWTRVNAGVLDGKMSYVEGYNTLKDGKGLLVDEVDCYGRTILMYAAYNGYVGIVLMLVKVKERRIRDQDSYGMSALIWATNGGHGEIVQFLLAYNIPVNLADKLNRTALHHALRGLDYPIAYVLVNMEASINSDYQLEGVLVWASKNGHDFIVNRLLRAECNPNEVDEMGMTALIHATTNGHTECVKLLAHHTRVNSYDNYGKKALWYAIVKDVKLEILEVLLNNSNISSAARGETALCVAASCNKIEHVKSILNVVREKQESWMRSKGNKALIHALRKNSWEIAQELVVAGGAAINLEDIREENALVVALEEDADAKLIGVILEQKVDTERRNLAGETPLLIAARKANLAGLEALLQAKADCKAVDTRKRTALDVAMRPKNEMTKDRAKVLETLIGWGAEAESVEEIAMLAEEVLEEIKLKGEEKIKKEHVKSENQN